MSRIFYILILNILVCQNVQAWEDKAVHFSTSFAVSHLAYVLCDNHAEELSKKECVVGSAGLALTLGFAKEFILDGRASYGDLGANALGVGFSIPLFYYEY